MFLPQSEACQPSLQLTNRYTRPAFRYFETRSGALIAREVSYDVNESKENGGIAILTGPCRSGYHEANAITAVEIRREGTTEGGLAEAKLRKRVQMYLTPG